MKIAEKTELVQKFTTEKAKENSPITIFRGSSFKNNLD